jgi:protein TonB
MFSNLIESGSHAADLKRKGRFFLGTILFYGLLLVATGIGSIYAYNARLDEPSNDLEVLALMRFPPAAATEPERRETRPAASQSRVNELTSRREISVQTPYHENQIASATTREVPAGVPIVVSTIDRDAAFTGRPVVGPNLSGGPGNGVESGPAVKDTDTPPPPRVNATPAPTPQRPNGPVLLTSQIIASKTLSKPAPPYPIVAKQAHIQGPVAVQIVIDEQGRVISARATSGNPLLQSAAVQAAYQARFTPTTLNGQAVKVTGSITYNFVLN